ncbi:MAG: J domain-containing protein [Candidatus Binatia bacterium]
MASADFYKILGVHPAATADEIRSAHRELVKMFHPDLFPAAVAKARANQKLQQINEAYAVVSNPERRRQYDDERFQSARRAEEARRFQEAQRSVKRATPTTVPRRTSGTWKGLVRLAQEKLRRVHGAYRTLAEAERRRRRGVGAPRETSRVHYRSAKAKSKAMSSRGFPWARRVKDLGPVKTMAGIVGIAVTGLILHAMWDEPEAASAWTLLESTSEESQAAGTKSGEGNWVRLASHSSRTQCVSGLKERVAMDERAGGKVFLDERRGTMAMVVYITSEAALAQEYLHAKLKNTAPEGGDPQALEKEAREEAREFVRKNGLSQRVKNYQCRELQMVQPESWLRRKLRQVGLVS